MTFHSSASTAALCLSAITHSFLLFHCFPYLGYMSLMVKHHDDVTVDNVGWYAGLLGTAFTTGRCLGFVPWKKLRHWQVCGDKNSLLLSLFLSAVCSVWFGMSTTFSSAVLARFCLGLSNSLSGCLKRIAINIQKVAATKRSSRKDLDEAATSHEEELAPSRILAVMWWGSVLGPCVGGMLSNSGALSKDSWMPNAIEIPYPFLLPNIVGAMLCLLSMVAVAAFVQDDRSEPVFNNSTATRASASSEEKRPLLSQTNNSHAITDDHAIMQNVWKSANTRLHLIAYWSFSFVVVCVDEALPLFLIAQLSGPGLVPKQIGWILSTAGLMVVASQSLSLEHNIISSSDNSSFGLYPSLKLASVLGNVPSVFVPVMLALNGGTYFYLHTKDKHDNNTEMFSSSGATITTTEDVLNSPPGDLNWSSFLFLAVLIGCLRIFCSMYFALVGVATGRTVPPCHRDHVARIMTLGALCARAVAPAVAGVLVSTFMTASWGSNNGADAIALWSVIGLAFGLGAAVWTFLLRCPSDGKNTQSLRSKRQSMYLDNRQRSHVFVKLWEVHYERGSTTIGAKWRRLARKAIAFNRVTTSKPDRPESVGAASAAVEQDEQYEIPKRKSWVDHMLQPGVDVDTVDFVILGTNKHDKSCLPHVLTPPLMEALHQHLPMSCREYNFWMKYSLVRDGASIAALEPRIMFSKNTVLAIETLEGDVFGCFMNNPWKKTNTYEMSGESFLWRMKEQRSTPANGDSALDKEVLDEVARKEGDVEIFWWTGESDECQLLSDERIAAGSGIVSGVGISRDGFGFIVEDGLSKGTSSPCLTYDNPSLVASEDGRFEVSNIEVWAMTPFLSTTQAEQSEDMVRFIQENTTNARGDAPSSAQSAWTNFL